VHKVCGNVLILRSGSYLCCGFHHFVSIDRLLEGFFLHNVLAIVI
jgi:hypothetical protein